MTPESISNCSTQLPVKTTRGEQLPAVSSASLSAYLDTVHQIPVLTREEEGVLFSEFEQTGDLESARRIVMSHLRYVVYVARGYQGYGLPLEDLIQQGNIGLMKSVKKFSLEHNVRLVSFAVHWIKAEIHEYILRNWKIVKVATTKAQRKLFFNLRKQKARLGWFSQDEVERVAADLNVKPADVIEMEARLQGTDETFDPVVEGEGEAPRSWHLSDGEAEDPALQVELAEESDVHLEGLGVALRSLDERSRDVVESRWLGETKVPLKELAAKYEVSLERIRQIEAKALHTMRPLVTPA